VPYISTYQRGELIDGAQAHYPGELTFMLYRACLDYIGGRPNFQEFAEVLGALEATKLEFYRRKVAPYEDKKIEENGDVV